MKNTKVKKQSPCFHGVDSGRNQTKSKQANKYMIYSQLMLSPMKEDIGLRAECDETTVKGYCCFE